MTKSNGPIKIELTKVCGFYICTELYKQLTPMWGVRTMYVGSWTKVLWTKLQDKPNNLI